MEKILQQILNELKTIKTDINDLKEGQMQTNERLTKLEKGQFRIEKKLDTVHDQTANLTEFRTETNMKLDSIDNKINAVEAVTKENLYDIAKLKLAK
ncbi:hypothetical protein FQB35_09990 [Crassaminicella thermophila]|uniref:Uncharacterized protein n=1 Tax=Crassaminicella thermophila TaxID=2599308 RepID=A0A5C0SE85_CRATE|nr:hypothetical protein [Crassaminicella thermophila]QEK12631.1 hypothetical protein FQB35_09990 [Crassaminicella thermophila]